MPQQRIDISAENINELFDRMENISMPSRGSFDYGRSYSLKRGNNGFKTNSNEQESREKKYTGKVITFEGKDIPFASGIGVNYKDQDIQQAIQNYLEQHVGEIYTVLSDGSKIEIGKGFTHEYGRSQYSEKIKRNWDKTWRAKVNITPAVGGMIEIAENPSQKEIAKHRNSGYYFRYDSKFAVPAGLSDVKIFSSKLNIFEDTEGNKYLYDVLDIKRTGTVLGGVTNLHDKTPSPENRGAYGPNNFNNIPQNPVNANEETEKIQNLSSASTSLNQVAAGLKMIDFASDTTNLDIGGGKYDAGTQYLAEKGVKNIVFDPFNRNTDENRNAFDRMKDGGVDTVTCNNVLNVIAEKGQRSNVILQAAKALKPNGTAYFTVYEGNGSGVGKQSQNDAWQNNRNPTPPPIFFDKNRLFFLCYLRRILQKNQTKSWFFCRGDLKKGNSRTNLQQ